MALVLQIIPFKLKKFFKYGHFTSCIKLDKLVSKKTFKKNLTISSRWKEVVCTSILRLQRLKPRALLFKKISVPLIKGILCSSFCGGWLLPLVEVEVITRKQCDREYIFLMPRDVIRGSFQIVET